MADFARFRRKQRFPASRITRRIEIARGVERGEQVRGILRVARKVPPGDEDDFEVFSNDSLIKQFDKFTVAVRIGVSVVSSIALLAAGIGSFRQIEQVVEYETQRLEGNTGAEREKAVNQIAAEGRLQVAELARQTAIIKADVRDSTRMTRALGERWAMSPGRAARACR